MKKLGLTGCALMSLVLLAGCSCSNTGTYKPYSLTVGDTEYVCGDNSDDSGTASAFCSSEGEYTLKSKGKLVYKHGNTSTEGQYKIEDGKLYVREDDDDDWYAYAEIKNGKMTQTIEATAYTPKIVYTYKK